MAKVIALGGAFLRATNPQELYQWYERNLGMMLQHGCLVIEPGLQPTQAVVAFFPHSSDHFPPEQPAMLNLVVDDLDAVIEALAQSGSTVIEKREDHDYGSFAWFRDPEGNRVELWQQKD